MKRAYIHGPPSLLVDARCFESENVDQRALKAVMWVWVRSIKVLWLDRIGGFANVAHVPRQRCLGSRALLIAAGLFN